MVFKVSGKAWTHLGIHNYPAEMWLGEIKYKGNLDVQEVIEACQVKDHIDPKQILLLGMY